MSENQTFVDYYELLTRQPRRRDRVHSAGAPRSFGPLSSRHGETGDLERFSPVNEAFQVLSDPDKRKEFDKNYKVKKDDPLPVFLTKEFTEGVDGESSRRVGMLCLLYTKRRSNPVAPSLSVLEVEQLMSIPREHLTSPSGI